MLARLTGERQLRPREILQFGGLPTAGAPNGILVIESDGMRGTVECACVEAL